MGSTTHDRPGGLMPRALGIYLNDHLAGATAGAELARRICEAHRASGPAATFERLAGEIAQDRLSLLRIMETLGVPKRRYKVYAGWAGERAARLKPNGRVLHRSGLSTVLELEALLLGIEGKARLWQALLIAADGEPRLDAARLRELADRATEQRDTVERLRAEAVAAVLAPDAKKAEESGEAEQTGETG